MTARPQKQMRPKRQERRPRNANDNATTNRNNGHHAEANDVFGLVSVLYHALEGNDTSIQYAWDARRTNDGEVAQFFDECRQQYESLARRAKKLLQSRMDEMSAGKAQQSEAEDTDQEPSTTDA
jgi:hypothetical protein